MVFLQLIPIRCLLIWIEKKTTKVSDCVSNFKPEFVNIINLALPGINEFCVCSLNDDQRIKPRPGRNDQQHQHECVPPDDFLPNGHAYPPSP